MKTSTLFACAFLVAGTSLAGAQSGPTRAEQMACRSDAQKLCASFIGQPQPMNGCLRNNKAKLSADCRKVVEARGG
ncbi:hypothetical protein [Bosea sp. R86505]|jgi:hypothetical protein|uniref:hypothetical protein n=1 Tax=Bosea sp. R86505 TaxID=3101710 RepID=UPI003670EED6